MKNTLTKLESDNSVPYPYKNAADLVKHCEEQGLPLSSIVWKNELALHSKQRISKLSCKSFSNGKLVLREDYRRRDYYKIH